MKKRKQLQKGTLGSQLTLQAVQAGRTLRQYPRLRTGERSPLCHGLAAGWRTRARSKSTSKPLKAELRWNTSPGKPSAHEALDGLTLKKQNPQLKTLEESDGILLYVCGGVCKI